jgi:hypothetical protein
MKQFLVAFVALFVISCGGLSVKQQIDRADRTAFASLRAFQTTESAAYHAKLPWPTDTQHQQIGAALSKAYDLVIDVAQAGLALKPGDPLPTQLQAEISQLTKLVGDVFALSKTAPPNIQDAATKAQKDTATLVTAVGGK